MKQTTGTDRQPARSVPPMTLTLVKVFNELRSDPGRERWAYELVTDSGGTLANVYRALHRLTAAGWVTFTVDRDSEDRAPRKLYRLTDVGLTEGSEAIAAAVNAEYAPRQR